MNEPNRLQVGLVIGGGIQFSNPINSHNDIFMIDLRYTLRHSWLGRDYEVDVGLDEYFEDFRTMEHIFSLSIGYMFEYNLGEERKGKTTKGKKIKTKRVGKVPGKKGKNINNF